MISLWSQNAIALTAQEEPLRLDREINQQVANTTSVDQLKDISPNDWAYEALRNLIERYNCLTGYPNGTFAPEKTLNRYEFAAGLNACINAIEKLLTEQNNVLENDLIILQRLETDFAEELKTIAEKLDKVDGQIALIENNSFSTTTKLAGEVIIAAVATGGIETNLDDEDQPVGNQFTLSNRVRLNLQTSFTGKDSLYIRLQSGNVPELDEYLGTEMARLGFDANGNNDLTLRDLHYSFPVNNRVRLWLGANSFSFQTVTNLHNPILDSSGKGVISRFNRRNPAVFRNGGEEQGIGTKIEFSDSISLDVGYFTGNGNDPSSGNGLFNGDYTAIGQLNFQPTENLDFGLAFGYSYANNSIDLAGGLGSHIGELPFGRVPTSAFRAGIQGSWRINEKVNVAGWVGYVQGRNESEGNKSERADIWNWSANISFLDLAKEGDFLALAGGMPPKVTSLDGEDADEDTSYILELLYFYPLTDNLFITPGAYVLFNPNHNNDNDTIWVSLIRTTFRF
jgi:hypothetical protein